MTRWACPYCEREFAVRRQAHTCVPGVTVDDSFAGRPPAQRAIYDLLRRHIDTLGPVHEDAVGVGVFLKRDRKFAEVRPMARALSVALVLPHPVGHPLLLRHATWSVERVWHVLRVRDPAEVDDALLDMVTIAYHDAGD